MEAQSSALFEYVYGRHDAWTSWNIPCSHLTFIRPHDFTHQPQSSSIPSTFTFTFTLTIDPNHELRVFDFYSSTQEVIEQRLEPVSLSTHHPNLDF
jgi:hypothetical protein